MLQVYLRVACGYIGAVGIVKGLAMVHPQRIKVLNTAPAASGRYVLYWMQASQREACNHALEYAVEQANELSLPLAAVFGVTADYPQANLRHYTFMLQGLAETAAALASRGVQLVVLPESPDAAALEMAKDAALLVTDRGYLRIQKQWRRNVAAKAACPVVQVESDVVVPVEVVSDKEEYAARTIRPKIHKHLAEFLKPLRRVPLRRDSLGLRLGGVKPADIVSLADKLRLDRSVGPVTAFVGGASWAEKLLNEFVSHKLADYAERRGDPSLDIQSHMSPYLHFGQISPVQIALAVQRSAAPKAAKEAYLEELIIRRELSMNFVNFNSRYDSYESLPAWAKISLKARAADRREYVYTLDELAAARTHDAYWNAAQKEMLRTGKMHNYMRMYWGKKIIEWTRSPKRAFDTAVYLNNAYELDGRDANSFAGVAWCFGRHDRPWTNRPIFGQVRYMNAAGLDRKFDMAAYVRKVESL